mmetsp:Transcript_33954/g.85831  ORF Transcript_33954/g.85831 Transcript_33954/m.85831 type:complete len:277 (+) Transcript_33954:249-1079(+)
MRSILSTASAPAATITSTARGTPPACRSCSAQPAAASRKAVSATTRRKAAATSLRYCALAGASPHTSGSGRGTCKPTPRASALRALTGWSPNPGHTTTGAPFAKPSVKLFCPPCVRKAATPARRMSTCGSTGRQSALAGGSNSPKASGCGPRETTRSGPSSAVSAPKASKAPPHAEWQSSRPVKPCCSPSAPVTRPSHPISGWSPVMTVPMLTNTTERPISRAARTCCRTSSLSVSWSRTDLPSAGATSNLWPAARLAPCLSNNGPTASNVTPSWA